MALSFTRAVAVEEGRRPTSTQLKLLARAVNDRLRGFSFCSWRIAWFWLNLFRQVRNPSADGRVFPPNAEFFYIYQFLDPEYHEGTTWPVAGPGEPEGANLASVMMQYVFGIEDPQNPGQGLDNEPERLNSGLPFLVTPTPTLEEVWNLGKAQRGVYDPATTAQSTPAFDTAQTFFRIVQPWWSPHGKALGGWLPTPIELLADCGATEATGLGIPSYQLKWTSLRAEVPVTGLHGAITTNADGTHTVTYAGTCACGMDNVAAGHVIGYAAWPFAWYIAVVTDAATCAYAIDTFPVNDWIEGPYEGEGRLNHTEGKQLQRSLWAFHTDFRGTPAQRDPDNFRIRRIAFDNQAFWTRQYPLAPNKGKIDGASLVDLYPRADWSTSTGLVSRGTFGVFAGEGESHQYADGFVLAGVFARATKLAAKTSLAVYSNAQLLATLDLIPDENGDASAMTWLKVATRPDPLKIKLASDARFASAGGTLYCECTEQVQYKPQFWDAALVSRVSASSGGDPFGGGVDGRGRDDDNAQGISDDFFRNGCLVNAGGVRDQGDWVNDNPVFDAARRLSRDHCRITRRQQLVSYEVTGGKSILRFKRFVQYPGIDGKEIRADCFKDIAPPLDPVAEDGLIEGETYIVRGTGTVNYRGGDYRQDQRFTATTVLNFQAHGEATVYVYDGIRHAALKKGFTNEWTMFVEPRCYHPSASSIWKPDAYSDYFSFCDRCHFYSGTAGGQLRRFSTFNNSTSLDDNFNPVLNPISLQVGMLAPEVPDQFRYANGANRTYGNANFYSSCQVYNRPYEIESCVVDDWADDQIIKVTLTGRLRSHPDAPAAVNVNPASWSADEIAVLRNAYLTDPDINEDYRTDDNAVREYVLSEANGNYPCVFRTGDSGTGSSVSGLPDNPFGACYPVFFFGHLIPEPYDDGNDIKQSHDSRCLIDSLLHAEIAQRAMCEGFVDARTSQDIICRTGLGNLYDYTFENLCHEAFGGRWIGAFDLARREDGPGGFGPLPNTKMYAEVFNRLVSCVNLLDKVRLDLPIVFKARTYDYRDDRPVTLIGLDGTSCTTGGTSRAYGDRMSAPDATTLTAVGGWVDWTTIGAIKSGQLTGCPYSMTSLRTDTEYRAEIDPAYWNAVPAEILDLVNLGGTGFLALKTTTLESQRRETVSDADADRCPTTPPGGGPFWFDDAGHYFRWASDQVIETTECVVVSSGVLEAPPVMPSDYKIGRSGALPEGTYCGNIADSSVALSLVAESDAFLQVPIV